MNDKKYLPEVKRVSKNEIEQLKNEGYAIFSSHNHTNFSDGADYRKVIDNLVEQGVNIIGLTDHNNMRVAKNASTYIEEKYPECSYIFAEEIDSNYGCVLAYGIKKEIPIEKEKKLLVKQIIEKIHDLGGLAVIAHPFHPVEGIFRILGGLKISQIKNLKFDGIEFFHADLPPYLNYMCYTLLKLKPEMFVLGGDDAHTIHQIGRYFNLIGPDINDIHNYDGILKALKNGKSTVLELMGWGVRPFKMLPGFIDLFIKKGLKRIDAFAGIYGLFKGIHFLHESMGWLPKTAQEFKTELRSIIKEMNINTIRLDSMYHEKGGFNFVSIAKELGLNVIISPKYIYPGGIDKPELDRSLSYKQFENLCLDHAQRAQKEGVDIFCIGNELTLELSDDNSGHIERFNPEFFTQFSPSSIEMIPGLGSTVIAKLGKFGKKKSKFTEYLKQLSQKVRYYYKGIISYAAGLWEIREVPWKYFDVICCNLYFSDLFLKFVEILPGLKVKIPKGSPTVRATHLFKQNIQYLKSFKKPVIISELGFQTVNNTINLGPMPVQFQDGFNQFKYDEEAQSQAFKEVFKLLEEDIFVNGVIIHEWNDHLKQGFGLIRPDGTPKIACKTISEFFKKWNISINKNE